MTVCWVFQIYIYFIIQHVKAHVIPCSHQPPTRGENTLSVAQGCTATPGATKLLLSLYRVFKRIIYTYIYIYICTRSTNSRDYMVHSSSFLVHFVIFKNAFTFGRWCHYTVTIWCHYAVTVFWCDIITQE